MNVLESLQLIKHNDIKHSNPTMESNDESDIMNLVSRNKLNNDQKTISIKNRVTFAESHIEIGTKNKRDTNSRTEKDEKECDETDKINATSVIKSSKYNMLNNHFTKDDSTEKFADDNISKLVTNNNNNCKISTGRKQKKPKKISTSYVGDEPVDTVLSDREEAVCKTQKSTIYNSHPKDTNEELKAAENRLCIDESVMRNLAACGTQISFSDSNSSKNFGSSESSKDSLSMTSIPPYYEYLNMLQYPLSLDNYKRLGYTNLQLPSLVGNGSNGLLNGLQDKYKAETSQRKSRNSNNEKAVVNVDEMPQDLTVNKNKKSMNQKTTNNLSNKLPINLKNVEIRPKEEIVQNNANEDQFSDSLNKQLNDRNFVIEVPSNVTTYLIETPSLNNLKEVIKDLKKNCQETSSLELEDASLIKITEDEKKANSYFSSAIGTFIIGIGSDLVQEYVQKDIIHSQKSNSRNNKALKILQSDMVALEKSYEATKKRNAPFKFQNKTCSYCNYSSESDNVIRKHLETPHLVKQNYFCNFCSYQTAVRNLNDFHQHMLCEHGINPNHEKHGSLECTNCQFSCKTRRALEKHSVFCSTHFQESKNLAPDVTWEPPAKIYKPQQTHQSLNQSNSAHKLKPSSNQPNSVYQILGKEETFQPTAAAPRRRKALGKWDEILQDQFLMTLNALKPGADEYDVHVALEKLKFYEKEINKHKQKRMNAASVPSSSSSSKTDIVICEICDCYLYNKMEFRNHLMVVHKVKIHPKMFQQKPNLSCEKCEQRFYTDLGLERHLLGKHGLVGSMLQTAASVGQDSGKCPICAEMIQFGLLTHMSDVHRVLLRPAFLSYKCTVCTATFPAYSLFETHVYTEHKTVLPTH